MFYSTGPWAGFLNLGVGMLVYALEMLSWQKLYVENLPQQTAFRYSPVNIRAPLLFLFASH